MADMPPRGAPASEGSSTDMAQAVAQVGSAIDALAQQDPDFGEVADHFRSIVEQKMGQGPQPAGGSETAEQGGNPNARPMSMGG